MILILAFFYSMKIPSALKIKLTVSPHFWDEGYTVPSSVRQSELSGLHKRTGVSTFLLITL